VKWLMLPFSTFSLFSTAYACSCSGGSCKGNCEGGPCNDNNACNTSKVDACGCVNASAKAVSGGCGYAE